MAVLQSIRKRSVLLLVIISAALLAFVLGDFINSSSAFFGRDRLEVGNINGQSIQYPQFEEKIREREQFYKLAFNQSNLDGEATEQIREYVWQQFVRQYGVGQSIEDLGIACTGDEIMNMIQTGNVTQTIRQAFSDQNGYNPQNVFGYVNQKDAASQFIWLTLEKELKETREYIKYIGLIASGLQVTDSEVEQEFAERTHISDIKYVMVPYTEINDGDVTVSDADLKKCYQENAKRFDFSEETRDVAYVSFDVVPSQKDSATALEIINSLKEGFEKTDDVPAYVTSKSDESYANIHYAKGEITNSTVDELAFSSNGNAFYGPYLEGKYYKMARVFNMEMLSDSVKAAHILIGARNGDTLSASNKADSLLDVINSGIDFGALAVQFSDDQGSAQDSGNLGWFTERINFIQEFKDACFNTAKGKIAKVKTAYGYHLIKVLDKTAPKQKVSVGFVQIEIKSGKETHQEAYMAASEFAGANRSLKQFESAVTEKNLVRRFVPNLTANARIVSGLENSREFVRWAFDEEKSKEVSEVMTFGERYVVAAVAAIHPKGNAKFETIKNQLMPLAINDKKAAKIIDDINSKNASNVDAVAAQLGKPVQTANSVSMSSLQIQGAGFEPAVIAVASSLQQNQVSKPIKGRTGVFVVENTSYTPAQQIQSENYTIDRSKLQNEIRSRATYQAVDALNNSLNIVDKRVKFF